MNDEMDFHRLEDIARFVAAKAPTRGEMISFLKRRQISDNIFERKELKCITFSVQTNTGVYIPQYDFANLIAA